MNVMDAFVAIGRDMRAIMARLRVIEERLGIAPPPSPVRHVSSVPSDVQDRIWSDGGE